MAQAYAQFRGVMTVELGSNSQAAFSQFTNQARSAGDSGARSMDRFNRSIEGLEGRLRAAGAGIGAFSGYGGRLASQFNAAANAIAITGSRIGGVITALAGGATLVSATNDIQNYTARLRAATSSQSEFNSVYAGLLRVSSATRSDLGETINFYTRLRLATSQLGLSQGQLAGVIQTVQQSIRLSGAGAQEANAALIQFVQGISSANGLSGDEFKSLGENATQVLRSIAQGLKELNTFPGFDGTISSLRQLGAEGKLTTDVVVPALQQVAGSVETQFGRLPPTIDQATTAIRNGFLDLIVRGERATGILSLIANGMLAVSRNTDVVIAGVAVLGGALVGRLIPALAATAQGAVFAGTSYALLGAQAVRTTGLLTASAAGAATLSARLLALATPVRVIQAGVIALSGALAFNALKKNELADVAARLGTSEDELAERVRKLTGDLERQGNAADTAKTKLAGLAQIEAQKALADARNVEKAARAAAAGPFGVRRLQSGLPGAEAQQLKNLIESGASFEQVFARVNSLRQRFPTFDQAVQREPGTIGSLLGDRRYIDTLQKFGQATLEVRDAQQQLNAVNRQAATGGAAAAPAQTRTLKEVIAASKEGATAADRYRESVLALNKEFGIRGETEFAKLSADRQQEYARRLTAIEQTRKAEIDAEKAAAAARRQGAREDRQNEQLAIRAINSIARDLPDSRSMLQEQIEAANKQAEAVTRIRQEDFARLATLDLQLQGEEATAEVLRRVLADKEKGRVIDADALRDIERQVEAEAARNVAIERRNQLLAIETRALGQIQGAFTTLFTGNTRGFLSGIGDAFRQQFAQRLSLNIFGDVERDAQLANTGALDANTSMVERLILAMEKLGLRITGQADQQPGLAPSFGGTAAANDNFNLPGGDLARSLSQTASSVGSLTRLLRDGAGSASIRAADNRLGSFGASAGGGFGTSIGDTLDRVFGRQQRNEQGQATGRFASSLGKVGAALGAAQEGSSAADAVTSIFDELGLFDRDSRSSRTGRRVGGTAGAAIGFAVGGPPGAAAGAFIGNIVGSTIGAAFKRNPFGDVALRAGQSGTVFNSRGAGSGEQALTLADSVNQGLERLAQGLGVNLRTGAPIGAIGFSGDQFFFNPTGGDFKAAGNQRFGEAEDAVAAAIRNAVQVGAFEGLRDGSRRLLLAGADINAQAQKAADFEGVFRDLRRAVDPTGAAVQELNSRFTRLRDIFVEAGASAEEYGQLQQLYDLQRAQALEQANTTLRDFLTELTTSSGSGLSVRDRQRAAQDAFAGFQSDIEAGRTIDQQRFRDAAQNLLDVNRELFGSQTGYFDTLGLVTDLTRRAISTTESQQSLPEALRLANQPVTNALDGVRNAIDDMANRLEDALGRMGMAPANDWAGGASYGTFGAERDRF